MADQPQQIAPSLSEDRMEQNCDVFWQVLGVGLGSLFILAAVVMFIADPRMLLLPLSVVPLYVLIRLAVDE